VGEVEMRPLENQSRPSDDAHISESRYGAPGRRSWMGKLSFPHGGLFRIREFFGTIVPFVCAGECMMKAPLS
jgi:hypothetical protein